MKAWSKIAVGALVLVGLAGCHRISASGGNFAVTLYGGDGALSTYQFSAYSKQDGGLVGWYPDGRKMTVSGTYMLRRTDAGAANTNFHAVEYHAQLFSGGKVVEEADAYSYSMDESHVTLRQSGTANAVMAGDYTLHKLGANVEGMPDKARFKVSLYNGSTTVGTWYAESYASGNHRVYLKINGVRSALIVGGHYIVEQIRR